jgi:zinc and cadmium transporter
MSQLLLLSYCICIVFSSLCGGALPYAVKVTHRRMQFAMSLIGGFMLGVAILHLLPHSVAMQGNVDFSALWVLIGLVTMFVMIRVLHVHAHEHGDVSDVADSASHQHGAQCSHGHTHDHHHDHEHAPPTGEAAHKFSWVGLTIGLTLHTLIDGFALGAAVAAESTGHEGWGLFGVATFLAVALHKPLDAMSITSLMRAGGWTKTQAMLANLAYASVCPLGAVLFTVGAVSLGENSSLVIGAGLGFSAGVFLCISLADLLPEVAFHTHDRGSLTAALLAGLLMAYGIGYLEPAHTHHHGAESEADAHGHSHDHAGHKH